MTTQTNRIAIALCESAGVKPYYPGKVNRWQWESYLPEARRLVEVFKPDPDIERDLRLSELLLDRQRLQNAGERRQLDLIGFAGPGGLNGMQGINSSQFGRAQVMAADRFYREIQEPKKPEVINTDRRWWQFW